MSFNFLGTFRKGSYMEFRKFVTNQLRSVKPRLQVIEMELKRIGEVEIVWHVDENDGFVTERRRGYKIAERTSIGKLMQAYIALGGNPFDISMFLNPEKKDTHPSFGCAYPMNRSDAGEGGFIDIGGEISIRKNHRLRAGQQAENPRKGEISTLVHAARRWCSQEIRQKRNNVEWQILKLCDLAEQLRLERDKLIAQAVGNVLSNFSVEEKSAPIAEDLTVIQIFRTLDLIIFKPDEDGFPDKNWAFNYEETARGKYESIYNDLDDEKWTAI